MRRLAWYLLLMYAFAIPWEYALDLGSLFGTVARLLGLLAAGCGLLSLVKSGWVHRAQGVHWIALAFLVWCCCTWFWSIDSEATLPRLRGYLQEMAVLWLVNEFAESERDFMWLLRAWLAGTCLLAGLTVASFPSLQAAGATRMVAEGQDPNDVARVLALGLPLAAFLARKETHRGSQLFAVAAVPLLLYSALLTGSRSGLLELSVALVGSIVTLSGANAQVARVSWTAGPALIAAFIYLVPRSVAERLATIGEQLAGGDLNQRLNIWDAGWQASAQHPFVGTGAGTFVAATGLAGTDTAHNTALSVAVEGGIVELTLAAMLIASVFALLVRTGGAARWACLTLAAVWLVASLASTMEQTRVTWLLFATVAVAARLSEENSSATSDAGRNAFRAEQPA